MEGTPLLDREAGKRLGPFGRLVATSNGTLQQIVSAWSNSPVVVEVVYNTPLLNKLTKTSTQGTEGAIEVKKQVYDRAVRILCRDKSFATAKSKVELSDEAMITAVGSGAVGLGQLFRQFNLKPEFELLHVNAIDNSKLQRRYTLSASGVRCEIEEDIDLSLIPDNVVESDKDQSEPTDLVQLSQHSFQGMETNAMVNDNSLRPIERVLMYTQHHNLARVLSSYLNKPVFERLLSSTRKDNGCYCMTHVVYVVCGRTASERILCRVERDIQFIHDMRGPETLKSELGDDLFGDSMPTFTLQKCRRNGCSEFLRDYTLSSDSLQEHVRESFIDLEGLID